MRRLITAALLAVFLAPPPAAAQQRPVELELLLAVDTSGSIGFTDFLLQREGLARAFRDPGVIAAIEGVEGGIAVALMQWGHDKQQRVAVDWAAVTNGEEAARFAAQIESAPRYFVGNGTAIAWAMQVGGGLFAGNGFEGRRKAIDISADGRNNSGLNPETVRDRLVSEGITVNALAIVNGDLNLHGYFETQIIGGPGAFVITAKGIQDYARAIRLKLLREIQPSVVWGPMPRTGPGGPQMVSGTTDSTGNAP